MDPFHAATDLPAHSHLAALIFAQQNTPDPTPDSKTDPDPEPEPAPPVPEVPVREAHLSHGDVARREQ